jgi:hypothetical protein
LQRRGGAPYKSFNMSVAEGKRSENPEATTERDNETSGVTV